MQRKDHIDAFGAVSLIGFSAVLGLNQVVIKITNGGLQPVFSAGLRSLGALLVIWLWMRLRRSGPVFDRATAPWGVLTGIFFASEFILLFLALDLTTVARASVMFYTMPVWLAFLAHFLIPGEVLSPRKLAGLGLAVAGVALALSDRGGGQAASLRGDLMALIAAGGWAGIALVARGTSFASVRPVMQLFWQLAVSSVILLAVAMFFGPLLRDFQPIHGATMAFQILVVASGGFLFWFWLLQIYPPAGVASFSFLSPLFGVAFGWLILGETVGPRLWAALALVSLGLVLINRPPRRG